MASIKKDRTFNEDFLLSLFADNQFRELSDRVAENIQKAMINDVKLLESEDEIVSHVSAYLEYFIQNNWTGPSNKADPISHFPKSSQDLLNVLTELQVDGENVYDLIKFPECLYVATQLIRSKSAASSTNVQVLLWSMRCHKIHQDLLRERSPTLKQKVVDIITKLEKHETLISDRNLHVEFLLEASHLMLFYYEYKWAASLLAQATELISVTTTLVGIMGKRSKFQENKVAQLICRVQRKSEESGEIVNPDFILPKDVPINSEVLLEQVQYEPDPDNPEAEAITPLESAFILSTCLHRKRLQASSELEEHETLAYLEAIAKYRCNWPVLCRAFSLRAVLEKKKPKRFERSLLQYEELLNQFHHAEPPAECRLPMLCAAQMAPIWQTEKELAHLYISYGNTDTALEIFLKLKLWPEAIECYTHLGRLETAEAVIRQQIALRETADLHCYLGDVTDDFSCYEKAWELSKHRSSRAQRSWALKLFYKGEFKEALEHFEKSLEINQLQANLWFTYGCACMALGELNKAIVGFRRSVQLEYDNFQGWGNLSACLAKINEKPKAFQILSEALKCNYENYRLWENFVTIGIDIGEFEQVIRGYHRLLDLRDKHVDIEILEILVKAVNEDLPDANGQHSSRLRSKLQELFGRQTSMVTTHADVWRLYGDLVTHADSTVDSKAERGLQHYQKSQRCLTQKDDYLTDPAVAVEVMKKTDHLLTLTLTLGDQIAPAQAVQMLASIQLSTNSVLTKVKNKHRNLMNELVSELVQPCEKVAIKIQQIRDKIAELNK